jgi:Ca-activated chloride channel family protein
VFPLDESAAVCGFAAVVGGVRYEGVVKSREDAFATYDDALAAGHGAFLLDEERPDVFTASIGNLAPGMDVQIELTYVAELTFEGDAIRFTLPTTVSPRYAPAEDQRGVGRPSAAALNPPLTAQAPFGLSFSARVATRGGVRRIESPSHPISVDVDADEARVTLSQEHVALDRDLVLLVTPAETAGPHVVLERTKAGRIAAAITFRPAFDVARVPADVVFVVDRSGSMQGSSIEQVRNALQLCLRSLEPGCSFNIVGFGSTFESLFADCQPYDERSLKQASDYVANLDATLGGTEILPALESVLENAVRRERVVQLVVMTDGQVTNSDAVIDAVRRRKERVRVFTFGIGRGASHYLVRGLARAGGGVPEFVYPGERIEPKVVRLFRRALSPAMTDVQLDWGGSSVTTVPMSVGPLFAEEAFRCYGLADQIKAGTVTLRARGATGQMSWSLDLRPADVKDGAVVGTLAARARIREIEEGGAWSPDRGSRQRERRENRAVAEIVSLALEFGLASRETSWVVVEKRDVPLAEAAELRRVPISITSGWGGRDENRAMLPGDVLGLAAAPLAAMPRRGADVRVSRLVVDSMSRLPADSSVPDGAFGPFLRLWEIVREGEARLSSPGSSTRALDRLVALQRADGSWNLDKALADVFGRDLGDLVAAIAGSTGDPDEARRAWATALALKFLEEQASANHGEWALLADKAVRWLATVSAVPPGGTSWSDLAAGMRVSDL